MRRMSSLRHLLRLRTLTNNNGSAAKSPLEDSFEEGGGGGGGSGYFSPSVLPHSASRNSSFDDGVGSLKIGLGGRKMGVSRMTSTDSNLSQVRTTYASTSKFHTESQSVYSSSPKNREIWKKKTVRSMLLDKSKWEGKK